MNIYYAILAAVAVAAFAAAAVYLIFTLIQLRQTAREVELLTRKVNGEMDKIGNVASAVAGLAGSVTGSPGRIMSGAVNVALYLFQRYRRRKPVDVPEESEEEGVPS